MEDRLTHAEGRLAQVVGGDLQLRRVVLDPGQQVQALERAGDRAVPLLDVVDHPRQPLGDVREGVHQRVAEQAEEPEEDEQGDREHRPDGGRASEPVPLEEGDRRVEHERHEGGDHHPQDELAEAPEEAVAEPGQDDDGINGQDGPNRDPAGGEPAEEAAGHRRRRWWLVQRLRLGACVFVDSLSMSGRPRGEGDGQIPSSTPPAFFGAPGRIRTCDPRFRKPTLYPLSYGSNCLLYHS